MTTVRRFSIPITAVPIVLAASLAGLGPLAPGNAAAQTPPLVSDLSAYRISITSSFTGTELVLFGAVATKADIVILVRGPDTTAVVRRKERKLGVWVNSESVVVDRVPGYYAIAANSEIQKIASHSLLARLEIGAENLRFMPRGVSAAEFEPFREALIRRKRAADLYREEVGKVVFLGDTLFHTRLKFPANVPVGNYTVQVFLIQDDEVVAAQTTPLFIGKTGAEQMIYDFANQKPALYGIAAIVVALFSGWLAATIFRKA